MLVVKSLQHQADAGDPLRLVEEQTLVAGH